MGLKWSDQWEDRISLYADDILVYVADQPNSLDRIMHIIYLFGKDSGYTINWDKSLVYVLRGPKPILPGRYNVTVVESGYQYLGIYATKDSSLYYRHNLPPLN